MRHLKTILAVLGATTALVLAGNAISLAATGNALILGKGNSASKQTNLSRTTAGPVLRLNTKKATNAPFTSNGRGKVVNLNADRIDGFDSTALRDRAYVFSPSLAVPTLTYTSAIPVPAGTYAFSYAAALSNVTSGNGVQCNLIRAHNGNYTNYGMSRFDAGGFNPGLSGAGVISKAAGDTLTFTCVAEDDFTFDPTSTTQLVMSPISVVGGTNLPNQATRTR